MGTAPVSSAMESRKSQARRSMSWSATSTASSVCRANWTSRGWLFGRALVGLERLAEAAVGILVAAQADDQRLGRPALEQHREQASLEQASFAVDELAAAPEDVVGHGTTIGRAGRAVLNGWEWRGAGAGDDSNSRLESDDARRVTGVVL
jgi:hypothetical protein